MSADGEMLNVVGEGGEIIGTETRERIHREGLLHREVHVWLYTPAGELIFQLRAKDKDTFPGLLDATCGGHVEVGMGWLDTAVKELEEETGLIVEPQDLTLVGRRRTNNYDELTGKQNNTIKQVYAYCFRGSASNLRVEAGLGAGFEAWSFDRLYNLAPAEAKRFIPSILRQPNLDLIHKIEQLAKEAYEPYIDQEAGQ